MSSGLVCSFNTTTRCKVGETGATQECLRLVGNRQNFCSFFLNCFFVMSSFQFVLEQKFTAQFKHCFALESHVSIVNTKNSVWKASALVGILCAF